MYHIIYFNILLNSVNTRGKGIGNVLILMVNRNILVDNKIHKNTVITKLITIRNCSNYHNVKNNFISYF